MSVRLGTGSGLFSARTDFVTGAGASVAQVGRLNADGNDDIAVANYGTNTVSVLPGQRRGRIRPKVNHDDGANLNWVAIADVNGDGKATSSPRTQAATRSPCCSAAAAAASAPRRTSSWARSRSRSRSPTWNGDAKPDVAVANYGSNSVGVLLGNSAGGFAMTSCAVPASPVTVITNDVTGDGIADVEVCCDAANKVAVLANNGAGVLGAPVSHDGDHALWCRHRRRDRRRQRGSGERELHDERRHGVVGPRHDAGRIVPAVTRARSRVASR